MRHRYESPRGSRSFDSQLVQTIVKVVRDFVIFVLGAYAFIYELLRAGSERPQILIMSAAMMGLPWIIRTDEKRQEGKANDSKHRESDGAP